MLSHLRVAFRGESWKIQRELRHTCLPLLFRAMRQRSRGFPRASSLDSSREVSSSSGLAGEDASDRFCHPINFDDLHSRSRFSNPYSLRNHIRGDRRFTTPMNSLRSNRPDIDREVFALVRPYAIKLLTTLSSLGSTVPLSQAVSAAMPKLPRDQDRCRPRSVKSAQIRTIEVAFLRWRSSSRTFARSQGAMALARFTGCISLGVNFLRSASSRPRMHSPKRKTRASLSRALSTDLCNTN